MKTPISFLFLVWSSMQATVLGDGMFLSAFTPSAEKFTKEDIDALERVEEGMLRRNLRSQSERKLDPAWCDEVCREFPFPNCRIFQVQCYDHRRQLGAMSTMEKGAQRKLQTDGYEVVEVTGPECDAKKNETLSALEAAVSDSGKNIITRSHLTCHNIVDTCDVLSFNLVNADTDTLVNRNMQDGHNICNGKYNFSIKAVADKCVDVVTFRLQGPDNYDNLSTDEAVPFFLFRNTKGDIAPPPGPLQSGQYTLTAVADGNLEREKILTFNLNDCN